MRGIKEIVRARENGSPEIAVCIYQRVIILHVRMVHREESVCLLLYAMLHSEAT